MKYLILMIFLISPFVHLQVMANVCSQEWWQNSTTEASMSLPEPESLQAKCNVLSDNSIECDSYYQRVDWLQTCDELNNTPLHIGVMVAQDPLLIDLLSDVIPLEVLTTKNLLDETPLTLIDRRNQQAHATVDQAQLALNQAMSFYLTQRSTTLQSVRNEAREVALAAEQRYNQARREQLVAVYIRNFLTALENQER